MWLRYYPSLSIWGTRSISVLTSCLIRIRPLFPSEGGLADSLKTLDEAIIEPETWELAQQLRKRHGVLIPWAKPIPYWAFILCRLRCKHVQPSFQRGGTEGTPYPSDFFDCSTDWLIRSMERTAVETTTTKSLRILIQTIRTVSQLAIADARRYRENTSRFSGQAAGGSQGCQTKAEQILQASQRAGHDH